MATTMRGRLGLDALLTHQPARRRATEGEPAGGSALEPTPHTGVLDARHRAGFPRPGLGAAFVTHPHVIAHRATPSNGSIRATALRYAAWGWPIAPNRASAPSTDLERIFAAWSRTPDAPIMAACGIAFDVVEADAALGRTALIRLDRLGVELGPVLWTAFGCAPTASAGLGDSDPRARIGFLVRVGTAAALRALIDPGTGPVLLGSGDRVELPAVLDQQRFHRAGIPSGPRWLRAPGPERPAFPAAHVVLGALALAPHRAFATI
ncbi:hypothetical protein KGA66_07140 [Actinocrinis puniceicyclus]|uniref:DNA primase/polymerase bifunctional N-terminal domain-containing protein n=1 Tax=Actinocrinis puniceicyclus TaxID=977794 RepID=A0A8J7WL20_9ACTN|nr:bifunctional DNA primase/polymerase [Actinocrinis puniceicyclus]MBS2962810.1 hypothetical protein [Actinocrinis puniceicyclus]